MKFVCEGKFIGSESATSKKGNAYLLVNFAQGADNLKIMADGNVNVNYNFGDDIRVTLEYDTKYNNLKLVSIDG